MTKKLKHLFATTNDTQILHKLVGFKDIRVTSYHRDGPIPTLGIEQIVDKPICPTCGQRAKVKERPVTHLVDLPAFGTPIQLAWKKHRLICGNTACDKTTWTLGDHRIAAKQCRMTTRAAKWVTEQVGRGRPISDVARELHCDWHTIANTFILYGKALLEADHKRLNHTTAIGLDETSFTRHLGQTSYVTTIADVENHQLIDILPTRKTKDVAEYLLFQPEAWKRRIKYGALDMSNLYSAVYNLVLPKAAQVVDPFHVVSLGNRVLDEVRRRVQTEQTGHRGRHNDPLYRARRVLLKGQEKLSEPAEQRRKTLLALGDPNGEVAFAYLVKERIREFYRLTNPQEAENMLNQIIEACQSPGAPQEIKTLGKTLTKWFEKICNYHIAKISNGPTEGINNLIKRIKRIGFGFRNFENYRIRVLLYAGKPNWETLNSIVVK